MVGWPKRVAHVDRGRSHHLYGRAGGLGYYTEHLVDALLETRAAGDEVFLIGNQPLGRDISAKWAGRLRTEGAGIRYVRMQTDAARLLGEGQADFAVFPNYLAPLDAPCPYLNIIHDLALIRTPEFFDARKRILVRALLPLDNRAAAGVGAGSPTSRRNLVFHAGGAESAHRHVAGRAPPQLQTVEACGDRARAGPYGLTRPYVLSVGTLEPRKNLPVAAGIDRLLARRHGERQARSRDGRWARLARSRAAAELQRSLTTGRVHPVGYVPEEDLVALYGGAAVLAYPSHFEGFGLPSLEAMACGTPVVAARMCRRCARSGGGRPTWSRSGGMPMRWRARIAELVEDPTGRAAVASARGLPRRRGVPLGDHGHPGCGPSRTRTARGPPPRPRLPVGLVAATRSRSPGDSTLERGGHGPGDQLGDFGHRAYAICSMPP